MPRSFCIPGVFFLLCATVLLILTSISLPYLTSFDITRVHFPGTHLKGSNSGPQYINQIRFGIWAFCETAVSSGDRTCSPTGHAYSVQLQGQGNALITIGSSWTRGLAVTPVAAAVSFIALLLSLSTHITVTLLASLFSFLAALITLIAFAIDIALYVYVKHEMKKLNLGNGGEDTLTGVGFWLTFASLILLLLAGCTVCFGRRRDRMNGATTNYPMTSTGKPGFLGRFRRNRNVV